MMHRLVESYSGDTTHMMWFDDDSCLLPGIDAQAWLPSGSQWVLPLELMRRVGWPGPVKHAGGDTVLGALLHRQGIAPEPFRLGLAINADAQLRESESLRRGVTEPLGAPTVWGPGA